MKSISIAFAVLALAGCSSVQNMSYGSWLEHVGERHAARYPFTPEEAQVLQGKQSQLQASAAGVRVQLAAEKDRTKRIAYLHQLEDIGDDLRPIQRQLRQGGTDSRRYPQPPDYTQAGGL